MIDETGKTITLNGANIAFDSNGKKFGAGSLKISAAGSYASLSTVGFKNLGTRNFTIDFWIYRTSVNDATYADAIFCTATGPKAMGIGINPDGKIGYCLSSNTSSWDIRLGVDPSTPRGSNVIPLNTWTHVALVRNGQTFTGYVNGLVDQTWTSASAISDFDNTVYIGHWHDAWTRTFLGYIDEFRIRVDDVAWTNSFSIALPTTQLSYQQPADTLLYTKLLLKGNGPNNSTNIFDECGNGVTVNGNSKISCVQSKSGGTSIYFDGSGDYLTIPYKSDFDWWVTDFTIEAWIYVPTLTGLSYTGGQPTLIGCMNYNTTNNFWSFGPNTSGNLVFYYWTGAARTVASSATISTNTWNHIAMTKTAAGITLFVNGVKQTTTAISGTPQSSLGTPLTLGEYANTSMKGYVQDLRISSGIARYTGNFTPSTIKAIDYSVLWLKGNGYNGSTNIIDEYGKSITISGDAKISTSQQKYGVGSIAFDGTGDYLTVPTSSDFDMGTGDFTIECWINPSTWGTYGAIFVVTNNYGIWFGKVDTVFCLRAYGIANIISTTTMPTTGVWTHVAVTRSSGTLKLFYNGTVITTVTGDTTNFAATNTPYIGYDGSTPSTCYNGYIQDLRIYKGWAKYTSAFTPAQNQASCYMPQYNPYRENTVLLINGNGSNNSQAIGDQTGKVLTNSGDVKISTTQQKFGVGSIRFDGTGDYLSIPYSNDFNFGSSDFTIEFWFYKTATANQVLFGQQANSVSYSPIIIGFWSTTVNVWLSTSGTSWNNNATAVTSALTNDTWYHFSLVRSGSSFTSYLNGTATNTITLSGALYTNNNALILGSVTDGSGYTGYIQDFRITKDVALYTANFTPPQNSLRLYSYYPLTQTNDYYYDNVPLLINGNGTNGSTAITEVHGRPVTAYGNASISTTQQKFGTGSLYFDGTGDYLTIPPSSDFYFGTGDFTVEFWFRPSIVTGGQTLIGVWSVTNQASWLFYLFNANLYWYTSTNGSTQTASINAAASGMVVNTWYHLALVRNSGTTSIYVNGTSVGSTSTVVNLYNSSSSLILGYNPLGGTPDYTNGYMQDIRISKFARYNAAFDVPTSSLSLTNTYPFTDSYSANTVLYLKGDCIAGKNEGVAGRTNSIEFKDNSNNNLTLTASGNVWKGNAGPYKKFGSMYFPGSTVQANYINIPNGGAGLTFGTSDFTIEAWVYFSDNSTIPAGSGYTTQNWYIASSYIGSNNVEGSFGFGVYSDAQGSDTRTLFLSTFLSGAYYTNSASATITKQTWYHVSVSRSSGVVRLFLNGTLLPCTDNIGAKSFASCANAIYLSQANHPNYSYLMTGFISNFHITKTGKYSASFIPNIEPVMADANTGVLINFDNVPVVDVTGKHNVCTFGDTQVKTFGRINNSSIYFDGTGDYLLTDNHSDFAVGANDFTIECWYYPVSKMAGSTVPYIFATSGAWGANWFGLSDRNSAANTVFSVYAYNVNNATVALTGTTTVNNGVWYHLAVVRSGTKLYLYVNGVLDGSVTVGTTAIGTTTSAALVLGAVDNNPSISYINGYIDSFRVTKGVARYLSTFRPPYAEALYDKTYTSISDLTATYVRINGENNSTIITEETGKAVTVVGNAKVSNNKMYFNLGTMYFDGSGDSVLVASSNELDFKTGDFTIEFWTYPTLVPNANTTMLAKRASATSFGGFVIFTPANNGGVYTYYLSSNNSSWDIANGVTMGTLLTNMWNHVALVRSGTIITPFINGIAGTSVTTSAAISFDQTAPLTIGGEVAGLNSYTGYIDEVIVSKYAKYIADTSTIFTPSTTAYDLTSTKKDSTLLLLHAEDLTDSSKYGRALTTYGTAGTSATSKKFGATSFALSGSTNYITLPNTTEWYFGGTDCTIECWFNISSLATSGAIIGWNFYSGDNSSFLYCYNTGSLGFGRSGVNEIASATGAVVANTWYHVAVVKYGTTTKIYLNGTSVASGTGSYFSVSGSPVLLLGQRYSVTGWNGHTTLYIDEVRISNTAIYTGNFTVPVLPFTS